MCGYLALVTMRTADGTKPKVSNGFSKSSSPYTLRGKFVIKPNCSSTPCFICINRRTADNCSLTSNVSTSVSPFSNRIWILVFVYDLGVFVVVEVDDGSAIVTVLGVAGVGVALDLPVSLSFEIYA